MLHISSQQGRENTKDQDKSLSMYESVDVCKNSKGRKVHILAQLTYHCIHNSLDDQDILKRISLLNYQHIIHLDIEKCMYLRNFVKTKEQKLDKFVHIDKCLDQQYNQESIAMQSHKIFLFYLRKGLLNNQISILQYLGLHINLVLEDIIEHISKLYYLTIKQFPYHKLTCKIQFYYQHKIQQDNFLSKFYLPLKQTQKFRLGID